MNRSFLFSSRLARLIFIIFSAIFITTRIFGLSLLPEKLAGDSYKILNPDSLDSSLQGSFAATSDIFLSLNSWQIEVVILAIGLLATFLMANKIENIKQAVASSLFYFPYMILNLIWAAKETFVVLLSLIVVLSFSIASSRFKRMIIILVLYGLYSYYIRSYYALILVIYVYIISLFYIHNRLNLDAKLIVLKGVAFAILMVFALPDSFFDMAQGQRDRANMYAFLIGSDNRTAFFNLVEPDSGLNFIINYIYALLVLALPVLVFGGFVDIVPTVLLIVIFYIGYRLYSVSSKDNFRDIYALFLAHYFVLVIFEPDVGSYMRHMTSVALYLLVVYYHISKYK